MQTATLLIRGAKQLLTLRGSRTPRCGPGFLDLGVIKDGAALISDGVLREVGTSHRLENLAAARRAVEINASGRVVLPGFIDSHTHLAFPSPSVDDAERQAAAGVLGAETGKRLCSRWAAYLSAMTRHGVTTVEIKTGTPYDWAEQKLLRVFSLLRGHSVDIVPTVLVRPQSVDRDSSELERYFRWLFDEFLPRARRADLARFLDLSWEGDAAGDLSRDTGSARLAHFDLCLQRARAAGLRCKFHAHGPRPSVAMTMAVRNFALSVDHLEEATAPQVATLAGSATMATLLPMTPLFTGAADPPARALVDAGIPIALGSDFNPRHSPAFNMQTVIALACRRWKLTPEEAIAAATINGAHALGCAPEKGSLEPGKAADLAVLNVADYRDLASHIGSNLTHITVKRGEIVYREGNVTLPGAAVPLSEAETALR